MEIVLASILNLASLGGLGYLNSCLNKEKLKLQEIEGAKVFSPTRLLNFLARSDVLDKLRRSQENPDEYILKAFIEGYTECNKPIQSVIDGKTQLIYSLCFKDEIYSNDYLAKARGLMYNTHQGVDTRAPLLFNLRDPNKDNACSVHRNLKVNALSALEKIAESKEYKHLNWFEKVLVYISIIMEVFALAAKTTFVFRGVKIGWAEREYGITLGTALTVFGDVIYNLKDKSIRIDKPKYLLHDKSNIIKKAKGKHIWHPRENDASYDSLSADIYISYQEGYSTL